MIAVRTSDQIYAAHGAIQNGTFTGRWHFSFGPYHDPDNMQFGRLRVFNDDTLSPGAIWPLHDHREIEVVTYCAAGEFRHADQHGRGGLLKKGWVQHTTVGSGMSHAEINDRPDIPMRFIQMWFIPSQPGLAPSVEQRQIELEHRTNTLRPLVSANIPGSLRMYSDAAVYSCFLQKNSTVPIQMLTGRGGYLYVLEGGPVKLNETPIMELAAAKIIGEPQLTLTAVGDAEILFVDTALEKGMR